MRNRILFFILILFSILSIPFFGFCAEKLDKIAAIVNGDVITEEEISMFMRMTDIAENSGLSVDDPKKLRSQILGRMIEDRLILQESLASGFRPDEKVIDDRIREIKERAGSDLAFEMALKQQGYSLSELRKKLTNQLLIYMAIQKEVKSKVLVSPSEVTEYYNSHQDRFISPESVVVNSIFVSDKELLDKVVELLSDGKDFKEVSKEYSQRSNLGTIARGQLKKDLEDIIFSLEPGVVSKPVSVEGGWYILLVKDKHPASRRSLADVKGIISLEIEDQKTQKKLKEWLERLKDKAYISIREE